MYFPQALFNLETGGDTYVTKQVDVVAGVVNVTLQCHAKMQKQHSRNRRGNFNGLLRSIEHRCLFD